MDLSGWEGLDAVDLTPMGVGGEEGGGGCHRFGIFDDPLVRSL